MLAQNPSLQKYRGHRINAEKAYRNMGERYNDVVDDELNVVRVIPNGTTDPCVV